LKRPATAAEMKYWKPLLAAAQKANAASQAYKVAGKTGVQTSVSGLNEEVWLAQQLANNTDYKKVLPGVDYASELNAVKTTDPTLFARQQAKKIYDDAIKAAGTDPAKIAAVNETTAYGRGLKEVLSILQSQAEDAGAINSIEELTALAKKLYDKNIPVNSFEGSAEIGKVLKTKNGLVKNQATDLTKIAADKKIYDDLIAASKGDPAAIAKAKATTAYGRGLANIEASLKSLASTSGAINADAEITSLAQDLYDNGIDPNSAIGKSKINSILKFGADAATGKFKGEAATTIAELQRTATANGLDLNKNFGDQVAGWITAINNGEQIDNIKQRIRDVAKLGQPDSVKKLIDNGTDLATIYSPYKNTMASVLEIQDPNSINLDDPTLRMAITPNGELNLYDYQKALRKDNRWQYTQQANQEVASATQKVLKDFGFMG
jgi:ribosomal protein L7Ae-like RNA K-turn-binding protein